MLDGFREKCVLGWTLMDSRCLHHDISSANAVM